MNIDEMNKDQLLIFLADLALRQGSVTGEVKFGTDIDELDAFLSTKRIRLILLFWSLSHTCTK